MFPLALPTKTTKSIKIRIFVDFTDLPFKNGTAHTKMSIFKNLRGPSARWSLVDVGRGGVHAVCMRCACGVHVVCMWCACGGHVVCMWWACGGHGVGMWWACGVHVVCVWCACGVHVVCMGCAWGVHGVCIVYVRCMNVCAHVVCVWYACNTHVVCTWCGRGMNAVRTWYARGMRVVYTWYTRAFHVVCMWYARGVHVVCMRYARDMHVVCTWYARGLHVVCTWYACGMHALRTYLENSSTHLRKTCTGLGKTAVLVWQPKHKHHVSRPPNECDNLMATVAFGDVVPADVQKWPSRRGPAKVFENRNFCMSSSVFEREIFEIDKNTYFCRF